MTKITNGDEKFVNDALISCRRREEKKGEPLECSITLCASCLGPPMATYRWQKHTLDESPLLALLTTRVQNNNIHWFVIFNLGIRFIIFNMGI